MVHQVPSDAVGVSEQRFSVCVLDSAPNMHAKLSREHNSLGGVHADDHSKLRQFSCCKLLHIWVKCMLVSV